MFSTLNSIIGTILLGGIALFVLPKGKRLIEEIVTKCLCLYYPIRGAHGQTIPGPKWKRPNGQCIDKFLEGRECSRLWQPYGSVYRVWSGTVPEIVITRPDDVRAFHSDSEFHNKARSSNAGWFFHQLLGDCMGLINGNRWRRIRKEFDPYFTHHAVSKHGVIIETDACNFARSMVSKIGTKDGFDIHTAHAVSRFPFMCAAEYIYGALNDDEKDKLWSIGQRSLALMGNVLSGGIFRYQSCRKLRPKASEELLNFEKEWANFNEQMCQARSTLSQPPMIVHAWNRVRSGDIPMNEMLQTLSEMLFANLDVSTHVLSWFITLVSESNSIQEELRKEFRSITEPSEAYCRRKDTLLHFCFLESVRLRPFTVFTIPESSPSEKVFGGYRIPPNTSVIVDALKINYNKAFWGDDSDRYNPKRFQNVKPFELRYNLFTFGFGTRKCLGQHFAEVMMKTFLFHLLEQYELHSLSSEAETKGENASNNSWTPISNVTVGLRRLK